MRARLALQVAGIRVELREIILKNKPAELLLASPKATVPVLALPDGGVIDESRDIMLWALLQHDPQHWLAKKSELYDEAIRLIDQNDFDFKPNLDAYKYTDRYPETAEYYRQQGETFLQQLEDRLTQHTYLMSDQINLADMAVFPFIRQFAHVDIDWFNQSAYIGLQRWLSGFLDAHWFASVMHKYPVWQRGDAARMFPE